MYYSTRDWLPLAGNLALAMALEPLGTAKRIRKKFTSIKAKSESANAEQPFFGF
jgi:hypothetical protein